MRISMTGILDLDVKAPDHLAKSAELAMRLAFDPMNTNDPFGQSGRCKIKVLVDGIEFDARVLGFQIDDTVAVSVNLD